MGLRGADIGGACTWNWTIDVNKTEKYQELKLEILSVVEGEANLVARMATVAGLLHNSFDYYFWTGFYCVDETQKAQGLDELVIGPYQGTLGCLRIAFGRGVCGAAAATRTVQIVPDVHAFPGHIACDSRSNSEIVLPVFDTSGELIGVFDVDSVDYGSFDDDDATGLSAILSAVFADQVVA
jgi:L-methionine (R)-S-oxide reductase